MKVTVDQDRNIVLGEIYNSVILETKEGNKLAVCMRDDTIEMKVVGTDKWHRVNMKDGTITPE